MKKVSFMKLNLQQENLLSKEEKKEVLGGYGPAPCYVRCGDGYTFNTDSCTAAAYTCGSDGIKCCVCNQGNVCY